MLLLPSTAEAETAVTGKLPLLVTVSPTLFHLTQTPEAGDGEVKAE